MKQLFLFLMAMSLLLTPGCGGGGRGGGSTESGSNALSLAPTALVATLNGETGIDLSWNPVPGVSGYSLEGKLADGPYEVINSELIPANISGVSLIFNGAPPEKVQFSFRLRSVLNATYGGYSNEAKCTTAVRAPSYLVANFDDLNLLVKLVWNTNSVIANYCKIERLEVDDFGQNIGDWTEIALIEPGNGTYVDHSVQELQKFRYRVSNVFSDEVTVPVTTFDRIKIPIFTPTELKVEAVTGGLRLSWTNRSKVADKLAIFRMGGVGGGLPQTPLVILSPDVSSFEDIGLPLGYYNYNLEVRFLTDFSFSSSAFGVFQTGPTSLTFASKSFQVSHADYAVLRPQGTWILANRNPMGVLSNGDPWTEVFSNDTFTWNYFSLLADQKGGPHWVHQVPSNNAANNLLKHQWFDETQWQEESIPVPVLSRVSGSTGAFRIGLSNELHGVIDVVTENRPFGGTLDSQRYLHKVDGAWISEPIAAPSGDFHGVMDRALSMDRDGVPHVLLGKAWNLALECSRKQDGSWINTEIPATNPMASDSIFGSWMDDGNAMAVFYQNGPLDLSFSQLVLVRKVNGTWQAPVVLDDTQGHPFPEWFDVAFSQDHSRVAVFLRSSLGVKVIFWTKDGLRESLVGPPNPYYSFLHAVGFDSSNTLHLLLGDYNGACIEYTETH